jgi:hypothetical protein
MIINQDDDGLVSKVGEGGGKIFAHFIRAEVTNISALCYKLYMREAAAPTRTVSTCANPAMYSYSDTSTGDGQVPHFAKSREKSRLLSPNQLMFL